MPNTTPATKTHTTPLQEELFESAELTDESNDDLNLHDDEDSYIYGDADASDEDTIETMTVYDPDADRFEDLEENSGDNETVVCHAYSRKTGEPVATLGIDEVSR